VFWSSSPRDLVEFGRYGPEDLEKARAALVAMSLIHVQRTVRTVWRMRAALTAFAALLPTVWAGGAILIIATVQSSQLAAALEAFSVLVAVGSAATPAWTSLLGRIESQLVATLRDCERVLSGCGPPEGHTR
jgi:hypothetical protein